MQRTNRFPDADIKKISLRENPLRWPDEIVQTAHTVSHQWETLSAKEGPKNTDLNAFFDWSLRIPDDWTR